MTPVVVAEERMGSLHAARDGVRERSRFEPRVAVVLDSGLEGVSDVIEADVAVGYEEIPGFPFAGHGARAGRLLLGHLDGVPTVALEGGPHRYEGCSLQDVTLPVRVARLLGAETLIVSGPCTGLGPTLTRGDLVLLDDQINLMGDSPLVGPNLDELGPRFPDMSEPYDRKLKERALEAARARGVRLHRGVLAAVVGPNLETRGECGMLRTLGADVVGASTVPEVIVARHMGMPVLGVMIVTDVCDPEHPEPVDAPAVVTTARDAEPWLAALLRDVVKEL